MTTTSATATTAPSKPPGIRSYGTVGTAADRCVRRLQRGYRDDRSSAVATLARLRRGAGRPANALPDLWGLVGTEELNGVLAELPPGNGQQLDQGRAEEALHLAVTLWALHQQSHRDMDTHIAGYGLGRSVRQLMIPGSAKGAEIPEARRPADDAQTAERAPEMDEPLRRRFVRVGTATSLDILAQRLREIVLLLRKDGVPLDYGLLADQLYRWQRLPERADVARSWGRDFHMAGAARGRSTLQS